MKDLTPPKKDALDHLLEQGKALTGLIPFGPFVQIFLNLFTPPFEKRQEEWMKSIYERFVELEIDISGLSDNQRFITTFMNASQIALRNHKEQKLIELRNAVINSIAPPSYDETLQTIFLGLLDRYTHWHFKVLSLVAHKDIFQGEHRPIGESQTIERIKRIEAFFTNEEELLRLILSDLRIAGLIDYPWDSVNADVMVRSSATVTVKKMGSNFLQFIEPIP